jgi:two-component system, NarL family, response regulator LiaR
MDKSPTLRYHLVSVVLAGPDASQPDPREQPGRRVLERDEPIRVILADDDPYSRRVLRDVLHGGDIVVIAEASNGREAIELAHHYKPDIVVMDLVMPGIDGLEATRAIAAGDEGTKVIILTSSDSDELGLVSLTSGAVGFLAKSVDLDSLRRAVISAHEGEAVVSRQLTMLLVESFRAASQSGVGVRPIKSPLTDREWEVLDLMCEGGTTDSIADELVLTYETVRSHVKNILRKLDVHSREDAVIEAHRVRSMMLMSGAPSNTPAP